jgi:hypothetical protein
MAYLKTEEPFERAIQEIVFAKALDIWRREMKIAVTNGIGIAFGGS